MVIRNRLALVPYLIALACVLGGLISYVGERQAKDHLLSDRLSGLGGPFALVDQDGVQRTERDFRGRYMLLYFGFTYCPDVCPTTLAMVADTLERLGPQGARLVPVMVSVDPARDKPPVLKAYLASFGPRFVGLTGPQAEIDRVVRAYGGYAARSPLEGGGYGVDHTNLLYLVGPDGKLVAHFDEMLGPDRLAEELRKRF